MRYLLLTACVVRFDPGPALIACDGAECPAGFVCNERLRACIAADNPDHAAPTVGNVVATPARAARGGEVTVTFDVNEPLGVPPEVTVDGTRLTCNASPPYACGFVPGDGNSEGTHPFTFTLVDAAGNEAQTQQGSLVLDFTPPVVTDIAWRNGASARPTAVALLDAKVAAPARVMEATLFNGDVALSPLPAAMLPTTDASLASLTAALDLSALALTGDLAVTAHLAVADDAGNVTHAQSPVLLIDAAPPDIVLMGAPAPTSLTADASFTFASVAADLTGFTCALDGAAAEPCTSPRAYLDLPAGAHSFVVSAVDAAGNVTAAPP